MTNYQECTHQWQNLEELLRDLKSTMKKWKIYAQMMMRMSTAAEREKLQETASVVAAELYIDNSYYRGRAHDLDGIRIAKGQISCEEFEALLYFAEVTGENREKWFYNFNAMYPWITYAWDERKAAC